MMSDISLETAQDLGNLSGTIDISGSWNSSSNFSDHFYSFSFSSSNLSASLFGMTSDLDLYLIRDANSNNLIDEDDIIDFSNNSGTNEDLLTLQNIDEGTYFIQVRNYDRDITNYNLSLTGTPSGVSDPLVGGNDALLTASNAPSLNEIATIFDRVSSTIDPETKITSGTLEADTFILEPDYSRIVFSGNGNIEYGSGERDVIDLSHISSTTVSLNLANTSDGGVLYDPGNGIRVFDAINLSDGREILFEGIEAISFADTTINLAVEPNDPLFDQQWNLHAIGVHNAWRFTNGSADLVRIGIQDTGLAVSNGEIHPDLPTTSIFSNNYTDEFSEGSNNSHGTAVQGIISAEGNNNSGISGINWNSNVFHIDLLPGDDPNDYLPHTATEAMINSINTQGKQLVINLSLSWNSELDELEDLVQNHPNVLFVIASGNQDNNSLNYPAILAQDYNNVIAVGAVWGDRDAFGNEQTPGTRISYNTTDYPQLSEDWWGSNYGNGLTLVAPSEVITTQGTQSEDTVNFGYYSLPQGFNGTSAATPHVTGVASLMWSVNPNLTGGQIKSILSETAIDLGKQGYDTEHGHGLVNADAAVRRAMALARELEIGNDE